jgi:hypothetical protein
MFAKAIVAAVVEEVSIRARYEGPIQVVDSEVSKRIPLVSYCQSQISHAPERIGARPLEGEVFQCIGQAEDLSNCVLVEKTQPESQVFD